MSMRASDNVSNKSPHSHMGVYSSDTKSGLADPEHQIAELQQAMLRFNQVSNHIVDAYQQLEGEVDSLSDKLAAEVANKEVELRDKQRLNARLQNLLSILPSGVVVLDGKGVVQDCNKVAVSILGEPLLGQRWINIIRRAFSPQSDDGHETSLKDGRRIKIETRSLEVEEGQLVLLTDLTETRHLQDKLNHDRRLATLGKMMGFLAHQIRTPLSSALLHAGNLADGRYLPNQQGKTSRQLLQCLHHLEGHIEQMLQFIRGGQIRKQVSPQVEFVKALEKHIEAIDAPVVLHNHWRQGFALEINFDTILSAIGNLIDNALDASVEQTKSNTSRESSCTSNNHIVVELNESPSHASIDVIDHGCGMDEQTMRSITQPFFTTKAKGNGLGLAVVQGVIQSHQGSLQIKSQVDVGTRMTLSLPKIKPLLKNTNEAVGLSDSAGVQSKPSDSLVKQRSGLTQSVETY